MTDQDIAASVEALARARRSGTRIERLPAAPASGGRGAHHPRPMAALLGDAVGSFKANAPPGEEPTRGLIYARMMRPSPLRMAPAEVPHLGVEREIAFRFTRDLPALRQGRHRPQR